MYLVTITNKDEYMISISGLDLKSLGNLVACMPPQHREEVAGLLERFTAGNSDALESFYELHEANLNIHHAVNDILDVAFTTTDPNRNEAMFTISRIEMSDRQAGTEMGIDGEEVARRIRRLRDDWRAYANVGAQRRPR